MKIKTKRGQRRKSVNDRGVEILVSDVNVSEAEDDLKIGAPTRSQELNQEAERKSRRSNSIMVTLKSRYGWTILHTSTVPEQPHESHCMEAKRHE